MALTLLAHPFSSYCQKALIALHANDIAFELQMLDSAETWAGLKTIWPFGRMPVLMDEGRVIAEASIIVEHLDLAHPGPVPMLPRDPAAALAVRQMDRVFDNYVMTPMMKIVADRSREAAEKDARGVSEAEALLDTAYDWLDGALAAEWAVGAAPSLADCAAAPALFYADWVRPIGARHARLAAYRRHLLGWAPFAQAVDAARPYRGFFPGGAPDRD